MMMSAGQGMGSGGMYGAGGAATGAAGGYAVGPGGYAAAGGAAAAGGYAAGNGGGYSGGHGGVAGGGGVAGCATGAGCAACACEVDGAPVMSYVGGGCGSYIQETTYRYVGWGAGDFGVVTQRRPVPWACILCSLLGLLALLALLLALLWQPTTTTTTTSAAPLPPSTCVIWGDPHIKTFDHSRVDFYDEGEVWLVRSKDISIQARYKNTPFTNGLSATDAIAVGGAFIGGHVLVVGAMETGQITWDGQPILTEFPSSFHPSGVGISVNYNGEGRLVDNSMLQWGKPHIVHIDAPLGVHIQVMRWSHHVNVRITMPPAPGGQDGHCGNFNGDAADDCTATIRARLGNEVGRAQIIFRSYWGFKAARPLTLEDCPKDKLPGARQACMAAHPGIAGESLDACCFDACFAGKQYIAEGGY